LRAVRGLSPNAAQRYGPGLLETVAAGLAGRLEERPAAAERLPLDDTLAPRTNLALAFVTGYSLAQEVDPALVAARADVAALVEEGPAADPARHLLLQGWRRAFVGEHLLSVLEGRRAIRLDPVTGLPDLA
jgi:ribonuclease D